ncbi:hypothetical protein SNE40_009247 [Patella caerulea]|uniref:Uncharacterized protein n=1 Tax=Patella caerulea TaxID=87958 RepID=A0AAN8JT64_PATCE
MAFSDISVLIKVSFVVSLVALIIHIIGYSTNYWVEYESPLYLYKYHQGLWRQCTGSNDSHACMDIPASGSTVELKTTRAFETMGFLVGIASSFLMILAHFARQKRIIRVLGTATAFGAGVLVFVGVIVFATDRPTAYEYGYSFALSIVGGILYVVTGMILSVDMQSGTPAAA